MYTSLYKLLLLSILLSGCTPFSQTVPQNGYTPEALSRMLSRLSPNAPKEESIRLAKDIMHYAYILETQYQRTTTPVFHNFLVTVGFKQKGLCYHYSDALFWHLTHKKYPHYTFHLIGANIGEYWREHNALLVSASKGNISNGIIIDSWRERGKVFFSLLTEDPDYHWVHRPERECQ